MLIPSAFRCRQASWIAIGIGRAVATFEPDLMRQVSCRPFDEELLIELDAAIRMSVELHHPAVKSAMVELPVDRAIERVGEIDALARRG